MPEKKVKSKLFINIIFIVVLLLPVSLIFSRAFTEIMVLATTITAIFYFNSIKIFILNKETKLDFLIIFVIFLYLLVNTIFSENYQLSLERSIPFARWIFFSLGLTFFFAFAEQKKINLFFLFLFFVIFIQSIYSIFEFSITQYSQLKLSFGDLTGDQSFIYRAQGFFKDSKSGSYLSKFFLIPFLWIYSRKYSKINIFLLLIIVTAIIISGERSAIIYLFITIFFTLIFVKEIRFKSLKFLGISFLIAITIIFSVKHYKIRIVDSTLYLIGLEKFVKKKNFEEAYHNAGGDVNKSINSFFDSQHGAHFLTAIEIWKKNKIFGSGIKTFRYMSPKKEFEKIKSNNSHLRASNHPHNYYLEILSEQGLIGLLLFFILGIRILFNLNIMTKINDLERIIYLAPTISAFCFFWPLITTGSFYTNWIATIFWFLFAMSIGFKYRYLSNKNRN